MTSLEQKVLKNIVSESQGNTETPVRLSQYGVSDAAQGEVATAIQSLSKLGYIKKRGKNNLGAVYLTEQGCKIARLRFGRI